MDRPTDTAKIRQVYARMSRRYDRFMAINDRLWGFTEGRQWAAGGALGRVLEVGIGTGRNLTYYPPTATLTGIDLSSAMLEYARQQSEALDRPVELLEGDMTSLPFPNDSFDVVVSTLTLCTVPEPVQAVREALRVLVPGGLLRCLEHGLASNRLVAVLQAVIEPFMLRFEADHLRREPDQILRKGGATIDEVVRSRAGITWRVLAHKTSETAS